MTIYKKLFSLREEAKNLLSDGKINASKRRFKEWKACVRAFLLDSSNNTKQEAIAFETKVKFKDEKQGKKSTLACHQGLKQTIKILDCLIENRCKKVFIVHGHNVEFRDRVIQFLKKYSIDAVPMCEQPNAGETMLEKLESCSDVDAVICLLTGDDEGRERCGSDNKGMLLRARQNVILELGYFWGKFGREALIVVKDKEIEEPSDIRGIGYITIDDDFEKKVLGELRKIGYSC